MTLIEDLYNIPHTEYQSINQLIDAHRKFYGEKLRAVVVFGGILTHGDTYDIDLLEVVEEWTGDRVAEFENTAQLPLRGKLRLYFLNPEEFTSLESLHDEAMRHWITQLLDRAKEGYQILFQKPPLFADSVLASALRPPTLAAPGSGIIHMSDPFSPPKPNG
jgi:hypothetical protein